MLPGCELLAGRELYRAVRLNQLFNLIEYHRALLVSEEPLELRLEKLKSGLRGNPWRSTIIAHLDQERGRERGKDVVSLGGVSHVSGRREVFEHPIEHQRRDLEAFVNDDTISRLHSALHRLLETESPQGHAICMGHATEHE